jgi:HAD superfamily hydrolase (TIGR01509 family)
VAADPAFVQMIRALIFDFDGLILDTETPVFRSWQELYAAQGGCLTYELWAQTVGTVSTEAEHFAALEIQTGYPLDRETLGPQRRQREGELILKQPILPGVRELLVEGKQRGLKIGLASSAGCKWVLGHLRRLELLSYFDSVRGRDDVERVKPDPELFLTVLADLEAEPREAVVFEDSPNGIRAAKAAGLLCVAVPNPVTRQYSLAQADLRLESLAEMPPPALIEKIEETFLK